MISKQEYQAQAAQGYKPHSTRSRAACRFGYTALNLPQTCQQAFHLPARIRCRWRTLRPLFLYRSALQPLSQKPAANMSMCIKRRNHRTTRRQSPPFIEAFHNRFKTPEITSLPRFTGGLVGYFGYETIYIRTFCPPPETYG